MSRVGDSIGERKVVDGVLWERTFLGWVQADGQMSVDPHVEGAAWERVQPDVFGAGDVAGEDQVGEAWSARWRRPLTLGVDDAAATDGQPAWAVVDCAYYGSAGTEFGYPRHVRCVTTFTVCTDPDQPYDTETTQSWGVDNDVNLDEFDSLDVSDERVRDFAVNDETPDDDFWNAHAESADYHLAVLG